MTSIVRTIQIGMTSVSGRGGGLDRYYHSLLKALPVENIGVCGLVVADGTESDPALTPFASNGDSMLKRWAKMRRISSPLIAENDLLVSHFSPYVFPILDRTFNIPLLTHFHGPWALESKAEGAKPSTVALRSLVERTAYGRSRRFIVLSQAFASVLSSNYGVNPGKIDIVRGGVEFSRFDGSPGKNEARSRLGVSDSRPILSTVRRLVPSKGLENLITAMKDVVRVVPDVLLLIAGTGPLEAQLRSQIEKLSLQNSIRLIGFVSEVDLPMIYRAADIFVVPTIAFEGFGLVVVEALACGTPALVTPVGGLPEVVRDLDPKLILEGSEASHVAEGLKFALQNMSSLPSTARCVEYARGFDWPKVARDIASIYRKTLAHG